MLQYLKVSQKLNKSLCCYVFITNKDSGDYFNAQDNLIIVLPITVKYTYRKYKWVITVPSIDSIAYYKVTLLGSCVF